MQIFKFRENRANDTTLSGVYIPNFGKILAIFFHFLRSNTLIVAPIGWNLLYPPCKSLPHWCKQRLCGAKNLKIAPWVT